MSAFQSPIHGTASVVLCYLLVQVPMWVAMVRWHAPSTTFLKSPFVAVPTMIITGIVFSIVHALLPINGFFDLLETLAGLMFFPAAGYAGGRIMATDARGVGAAHRRGAIVSRIRPTARRSNSGITLAGIPVAPEDETKHFKFIGTTGTGKSTAIREMLSAALARGDRAIFADPDGGYLARFYDEARGDVILNPFDGEARKWDLFGEITNDYDVEQLARSLIPDSGDSDRIWSEYARTFFGAVAQQVIVAGVRTDAELYRLLTGASVEELRVLLAGTAAGPFLETGNEKMFGSVRSIASSAVRALKYTSRQQATPFSVRQWVRHGAAMSAGGQGGALFLPYKAGEIAALRSVISAWMRIGIFEAMDRDEADQRLWFVIDELDALGEIDGLKDALARLRKFGGRCVLGFQSIGQVSGTYGKGVAETIVENCGNTLILRCSASEHGGTSEFASKLIGQREVMHTTVSKTRHPSQWSASTTSSQHLKIEPAIMASEIERLPDLEGFLKLASIPDWYSVTLTPMTDPTPVRPRKPNVVASPSTSVIHGSATPGRPDAPMTVNVSGGRRAKSRTAVPKRTTPAKAIRQVSIPLLERPAEGEPPPEVTPAAEAGASIKSLPGASELRN